HQILIGSVGLGVSASAAPVAVRHRRCPPPCTANRSVPCSISSLGLIAKLATHYAGDIGNLVKRGPHRSWKVWGPLIDELANQSQTFILLPKLASLQSFSFANCPCPCRFFPCTLLKL